MLRRLLQSKWTYYALAAALALGAVLSQVRLELPARPKGSVDDIARLAERDDLNVVFILIDTLRSNRLSSYGYARNTSPVMDHLARTGVRFAHVEAQSTWTKCSMASLWTGMVPVRTGVTRANHALADQAILGVEQLREAGFRTGGIFRNGWVAPNFGFSQGFDLYVRPGPRDLPEMRRVRQNLGVNRLLGTDADATQAAVEFLRANSQDRFFLYVHYMDVHQYLYDEVAAELGFGTGYSDAYDASIHWVDRNVGSLVVALEEMGLAEETVVVIASDHGEGFYEHGQEFHARTLYREVTEVPLILVLPFHLSPGIVVDPLVRNVDVWPTLLDLLGLPPLPEADGRSLVPLIQAAGRGEAPPAWSPEAPPAFAFLDLSWARPAEDSRPLVSLRQGSRRLLYRTDVPNRVELYDHASDPTEQIDLAAEQPEEVERLRSTAEAELERKPPWGAAPETSIDEMQMQQLRALGYIEDGGR